jgi:outer membrane protein TolC
VSRWIERWGARSQVVAAVLALSGASVRAALAADGVVPRAVALEAVMADVDSAAASAQSSSPQSAAQAEEILVRSALAHNPELRVAHWDENVARAEVRRVGALSNPVLRGEWLHVQNPEGAGWGFGIEWSPPRPGVDSARQRGAQADVRAVTADLSESAADVEAQVRVTCAQIAALSEQIALAEASVGTRRAIHDTCKERVLRGASSRIDLSLAVVSVLHAEQERDQLSLERSGAVARLEALVGAPPDGSFGSILESLSQPAVSAPAPPPERRAEPVSARELVQRAIAVRPSVGADEARAEAARQAASSERAKRWPWFEIQARYRRHDQSSYANDVTLGLDIELPILDGNAGGIAAADARQSQERDRASAHRSEVERQVRALRAESTRRGQIADAYAESMGGVLREHAILVKTALEGMELDLMAVLHAEDMITRGRLDYVKARLAERQTNIALARALGEYGPARATEVE